jgi:hypothetical protein
MPKVKKPKAGDIVLVRWRDITEDPVGDPNGPTAGTLPRTSIGFFVRKTRKTLFTSTMSEGWDELEFQGQSGWCAYPAGVIDSIEIIREAVQK